MTLSTTQTASHKCRIQTNYQLQYAVNVYHVRLECLQNICLNSILHHNITNIVLLLSASASSNQTVVPPARMSTYKRQGLAILWTSNMQQYYCMHQRYSSVN